jgi:hypothetical protein
MPRAKETFPRAILGTRVPELRQACTKLLPIFICVGVIEFSFGRLRRAICE